MKSKDQVLIRLKESIEEITLGAKQASNISDRDSIISDIGLDSLDYASILLDMEQWLGIHVKEDGVNWRAIQTVEQLATFLGEQQEK